MTKKALSNIQVAERQLTMALRIYFEDQDYVSAITLAGAAEEILGKILMKSDSPNAMDMYISAMHNVDEIFGGEPSDEKEYRKELNRIRNTMKHMAVDGVIIDDIKYESQVMIDRAITNWRALNRPLSPSMEEFLARDD